MRVQDVAAQVESFARAMDTHIHACGHTHGHMGKCVHVVLDNWRADLVVHIRQLDSCLPHLRLPLLDLLLELRIRILFFLLLLLLFALFPRTGLRVSVGLRLSFALFRYRLVYH